MNAAVLVKLMQCLQMTSCC